MVHDSVACLLPLVQLTAARAETTLLAASATLVSAGDEGVVPAQKRVAG